MALKTSSSSDNVVFNHVVGPIKGEKVLVNPSLKELHEYGAKWIKNEPKYLNKDNDGNDNFAVDVWFKIEEFAHNGKVVKPDTEIRNVRFYIKPIDVVSKAGNTQFVNQYGNFAYAKDVDSFSDKFRNEGVRKALNGEETLYKWLRAFGDFRKADEMLLSVDKLSKGDFSEIREFADDNPAKKFMCLMGTSYNEDKGWFNPVVYTREFWRSWNTTMSIKVDNDWKNFTFKEGVPVLLEQEFSGFNKSVYTPGVAEIRTSSELQNLADLPDLSEEMNANATQDDSEDLPF